MARKRTGDSQKNWTTVDEINYLNNAGSYYIPIEKRDINLQEHKIKVLKGALIAYNERTKWGNLNKEAIINHAKSLIAELEN